MHGSVKTVLVALLALVLGTSNAVCACLSLSADASQADSHQTHLPEADMAHAVHGALSEHHQACEKRAPCAIDERDCEHCASTAYFKATAKTNFIASPAYTSFAKAITTIQAVARPPAGVTAARLVAFRWQDPPGQTPVTLKTRLQN